MTAPARRRAQPARPRYLAPRFFLDLAALPTREIHRIHGAASHALEQRANGEPRAGRRTDGRVVASALRVEVSALAVELRETDAPPAPPPSSEPAPPRAPDGVPELFRPRSFNLPWGTLVLPRAPAGFAPFNVAAGIAGLSPDELFRIYREDAGHSYGEAVRRVVLDLYRLGRLWVGPPPRAAQAVEDASTHRTHAGERLPPRLMVRDGGQLGWHVLGKRGTYHFFDARGRELGTARRVRGHLEWMAARGWFGA